MPDGENVKLSQIVDAVRDGVIAGLEDPIKEMAEQAADAAVQAATRKSAAARPVAPQASRDYGKLVQSPRNAIQIINAFAQTWWIADQRERSGVGSDAPGALSDGAVTDNPLALAALCVLRVDFPDFFNEVQKRPELIHEFT